MKCAIFSDIHGNMSALREMFADAAELRVEKYLFAGDVFGYFYEQDEIVSILMENKNLYCVKGNHDENYLKACEDKQYQMEMSDKYGCSYQIQLKKDKRKWLSLLPSCLEIQLGKRKICMVHGNLQDRLNGRIYPDALKEIPEAVKYDLLIMGHTHYGMLFKQGNCIILNPSSLGQPRDKQGFRYAIYDTEKNSVQFREVCINIEELLEQVKKRESSKRNREYLFKCYGEE